ncbi:type IV toxin-antitoxin system AbiEi family antitoxin domain-containing protein [Nocardioides marmoraquaticus]
MFTTLASERHTFQRAEFVALGLKDRDLYRGLREKVLHRVRQGTYAMYDEWHAASSRQQHLWRARAVLRTAGADVALTSVTVLVAMDSPAWNLPLDDVHLLRTDARAGRREAGVVQHRGRVEPGDVLAVGQEHWVSAARACVELTWTRGIDIESVVVAIDDLLRRGLVTENALYERAAVSKQVPGSLRTDLIIGLCDARRESVGESRTAYACWKASLPPHVPQLELVDEHGRAWARLDFAWPQLGVWLEFDGKEKYLMDRRPGESRDSAILRAKRAERDREQAIAKATGWRCVRVTWADLENPERLVRRLRREVLGIAA